MTASRLMSKGSTADFDRNGSVTTGPARSAGIVASPDVPGQGFAEGKNLRHQRESFHHRVTAKR